MKKIRKLIALCGVACAVVALSAVRGAAQTGTSSSSSGFFGGIFGHSSTPTPAASAPAPETDDEIAIKNQKKPGVELYVAVANLYTQTGKFAEAEQEYRDALKIAPDDIRVLLGYAMLKDQVNQPDDALKLYQQAEKKHPKQPSVYNNLAVHYIRFHMLPEAIEAAQRAVELRPQEARFRNNLAALLVEAGRPQEAFKQLRAVYDEPVSHYNLGFLLNKADFKPGALQEFAIALQMNPRMTPARQWVERLSQEMSARGTALGTTPPQRPAPPMPGPYYGNSYAPPVMAGPPPQYQPQQYQPPQYQPPQYATAPQTLPAQAQNPLPQYRPQYAVPPRQDQYVPPYPPQNQAPAPNAAAPANSVPLMAQVQPPPQPLPPPPTDTGSSRRLPPAGNPADAQNSDVAPDPPNLQR